MANPMSEDALFKALLKNKPTQQQIQKPPAAPQPAPKKEIKPAAPPAEIHEIVKPVIETPPPKSHDTEQVVEAVKNLTSSVNMMYGLMKTVITPVLVLILIIGIAILVKGK